MYSNPEMAEEYARSYLILAGDICQIYEKEKFRAFFDIVTKIFKNVIYVTGNHEYHRITYGDILINQGVYPYSNVYFLQNDFIDLLLLSKCHTLYGTTISTFTEMSWWFSECKQKIILSFKCFVYCIWGDCNGRFLEMGV